MADPDEYERGVYDAQREGILGDWCHDVTNTGSPYDKGYEFGHDHRYDSSGERYHTWDNKGTNDPKPDNSNNYGSWFGSGMFCSNSSGDSAVENDVRSPTPSSEGGDGRSYYVTAVGGTRAALGIGVLLWLE